MDNSTKIIVGAGAGVAVVVAWEFYPQKNIYKLDTTISPLAFLEHQHWGMVSLIAATQTQKYKPYLNGIGAVLILSELIQDHPYGIGKSIPQELGNLAITALLGSILYGTLQKS